MTSPLPGLAKIECTSNSTGDCLMQQGDKKGYARGTAGTAEVKGHVEKEKRRMRFYVTSLQRFRADNLNISIRCVMALYSIVFTRLSEL